MQWYLDKVKLYEMLPRQGVTIQNVTDPLKVQTYGYFKLWQPDLLKLRVLKYKY